MREQLAQLFFPALLSAALLLALAACAHSTGSQTQPPPPGPSYTGTLRGGIMGIGGESTGWQLEVDDGEFAGRKLDTDVSRVRDAARAFEGRRVRITGKLVEKDYVERGKVNILAAAEISLAE